MYIPIPLYYTECVTTAHATKSQLGTLLQFVKSCKAFSLLVCLCTDWIGIKEEDRSSEYGSEHAVVKDSGGIDTHIVEGHGSDKTHHHSKASHSSVDVNPISSVQRTGGCVACSCTTGRPG